MNRPKCGATLPQEPPLQIANPPHPTLKSCNHFTLLLFPSHTLFFRRFSPAHIGLKLLQ
jgi:hypothetical protein